MARETFPAALNLILKHEGGYVDHPLDPGGATNFGITRATLAAVRGRPVSKAEVMSLTRQDAADIYRARYWDAVAGDDLPAGIDLVIFDAAVNSGPSRAVRWLQEVLALRADGVMGSNTIAAVRQSSIAATITGYSARRLGFLQRLSTWRAFGRGWSRRVRETETAALAMAGQGRSTSTQARRKQENVTMDETKSLLSSKTLWSNLVGLAAVVFSTFGLDTSGVDSAGLSQAIPQAVAAISFIASTVFRVTATKRLSV